jgi:quinol monooxygenase YgiN
LTPIFRARPETAEAFAAGLTAMVEPSRKEAGCIEYNAYRSNKDPLLFLLWERWSSQAHLDAHCETPHFLHFAEHVLPLLSHPSEDGLHFLQPLV